MSTVKEGMMDQSPAWKDTPSDPVVIRHRSGSVSSRRAYPTATNPRFVPNRTPESTFEMISVGEGNDVYLPPDEQVDPLSEEAKNRIKRIRNIGGGVQVLIEQEEGDLDNELRTLKSAAGALLSVTQKDEENEIDSTGVTAFADLPGGGFIATIKGIVSDLVPSPNLWSGTIQLDFTDNVNGSFDWTLFITVVNGSITAVTENGAPIPNGGLAKFSTNNS